MTMLSDRPSLPSSEASILRQAERIMIDELRTWVPYRTGRLYRSLRWRYLKTQGGRILSITFTAPYAAYTNRRYRNKGWARRGMDAGIKRANTVLKAIGMRFRLRSIRPFQKGKLRIHVRLVG